MVKKLVFIALIFLTGTTRAAENGPKYDLIFGVHVYAPGKDFDVDNFFYVRDDGVVQVEYRPMGMGDHSSHWIVLYRYDWKTKVATYIPTPGPAQIAGTKKKEYYIPEGFENLRLLSSDESPDGYKLAEPRWVRAGPVDQVLGNIALLLIAGGVEEVKKKERIPRIEKGSLSFQMKGEDIFGEEDGSTAFTLGWVKR